MKFTHLAAAVGLAFSALAGAQTSGAGPAASHAGAATAATAATDMSDGEVRKVDKEQGKITLRHGPIANLDMPAMTMVFMVSDAKMLDTVKVGDKVKFSADKVNGAITVTAIEAAK
jgi:Cu(I)/Ag(I) efflux system protein CusF